MANSSFRILNSFSKLQTSQEWSFSHVGRQETGYITHGYHKYPAKFIPQIVDKVIKKYTDNKSVVIDPFGGCGTTLVECKVMGRASFGFDLNPLAKLITEVKTTPIIPKKLDEENKKFLARINIENKAGKNIVHKRLNYWFEPQIIQELDLIYQAIKDIKDIKIRKFYFCAFSNILKNSSRWLSSSIKPQIDPEKKIERPMKLFSRHLNFMSKRNDTFYKLLENKSTIKTPTIMRIADSTKKLPISDNSADIIITSPPYVTSYEYADLHQLSLYWFGLDKTFFKGWDKYTENFGSFKKQFIGTNMYKDTKSSGVASSEIAKDIVKNLMEVDKPLGSRVNNYFWDMEKSFKEMQRILKPNAKVCIIIGNTSLKGVEIKNAEVAFEQMENIGMKKIKIYKREIVNKMITSWRDKKTGKFTNSSNGNSKRTYQYEYILIMQNAN